MNRAFLATVNDLAECVRSQRAILRITQQQVADKAGVSRAFVADLENGHPRAEVGLVLKVLDALNIQALAIPSVATSRHLDDVDLDEELAAYVTRKHEALL